MLHYRTLWLSIGWFFVFFIWGMSLIRVPEQLDFKINQIDKVEHFVAYFFLMAWFAQLYYKKSTRLFYAIGFILMGIAIEIVQGLGGIRMFDPFDILANSIGVLLAWYFVKENWAEIFVHVENKFIR